MVHFSCADFAFPFLTHENSLKLIQMMGFEFVDIGLFQDRSHIQPSDQLDAPEKKGLLLKQKAADAGLAVSDIFLQSSLDFKEFAINHPDAAIRAGQRDVFRRLCDYALAAGCDHVGGLPGASFNSSSWSLGCEELAWRAYYAKEHGLSYGIEAHLGSFVEKPEDTLKMLREVDGMALILDHSHYTFQGYDTESLRPLMHYASHMHVRGARKGEMQCSVERNETDFAAVAEHMKAEDYSGTVCVEYTYTAWENCNRTDNVSETVILTKLMKDLLK